MTHSIIREISANNALMDAAYVNGHRCAAYMSHLLTCIINMMMKLPLTAHRHCYAKNASLQANAMNAMKATSYHHKRNASSV